MTQEQPPERLAYSIPESAQLLGVSESTVKRLIASGKLTAVKVGVHRRIPRTELYRLLEPSPQDAQEAL